MKTILRRDGILERLKQGAHALTGERLERLCVSERAAPSEEETAKLKEQLGGDIVGRIVPFVVSTPERASDDHTLDPMGCDDEEYARAPHVFWQHKYRSWDETSRPNARIGVSVLRKDKGKVTALFAGYTREFSEALDGGFSWALSEIAARQGHRSSVGFDVVEAAVAPEEVRKAAPWALDISRWRVREWSFVNFGADANAITEGRVAGIDVEPIARALERFLDELAGTTGLGRERLADMWAAAADPGRARVVVAPAPAPAPTFDADAFRAELRAALATIPAV
jgi:hypothetical protein